MTLINPTQYSKGSGIGFNKRLTVDSLGGGIQYKVVMIKTVEQKNNGSPGTIYESRGTLIMRDGRSL